MNSFNIEEDKVHFKHEYRGELVSINYRTPVNYNCLCPNKNSHGASKSVGLVGRPSTKPLFDVRLNLWMNTRPTCSWNSCKIVWVNIPQRFGVTLCCDNFHPVIHNCKIPS